MVTVDELCRVANVSPSTIKRYQKLGLIFSPIRRRHPSGRGLIGYWPDETLRAVRDIRRLLDEGLSLEQVRERLQAQRMRNPQEVRAAMRAVIHEWRTTPVNVATLPNEFRSHADCTSIHELYVSYLAEQAGLMGSRAAQLAILEAAGSDDMLAWTLEWFDIGYAPVLLWNPLIGVRVTTDFMLGHELNTRHFMAVRGGEPDLNDPATYAAVAPMLVMPLHHTVRTIYSLYLPEDHEFLETHALPVMCAANMLHKYDGDAVIRAPFSLIPVTTGEKVTGPAFMFSIQDDQATVLAPLVPSATRKPRRKPGRARS